MKGKSKKIFQVAIIIIIILSILFGTYFITSNTYFGAKALTKGKSQKTNEQNKLSSSYIKAVSDFGANSLAKLSVGPSNYLISPLGMSLNLSAVLSGAKNQTYDELKQAMCFNSMTDQEIFENSEIAIQQIQSADKKVDVNISSALWCDSEYEFQNVFLANCKKYFNYDIYQQNFRNNNKVVKNINKWVSNKSKGHIPTITDKLQPNAKMVLVNAVFFKGKWLDGFDKKLTKERTFYLPDKSNIICDFMQSKKVVDYRKTESFEAVSIPYKSHYSMVLAMPNEEETPESLLEKDKLHEILNYKAWSYGEFINKDGELQEESSNANLKMPKFSFTSTLDMITVLKKLGVSQAFSMADADFSGMDKNNNIYLQEVKQKSFIDVDEEKTIAVSINFSGFGAKSSKAPLTENVVFDRPFIFSIVDQFGLPLFLGIINNPIL